MYAGAGSAVSEHAKQQGRQFIATAGLQLKGTQVVQQLMNHDVDMFFSDGKESWSAFKLAIQAGNVDCAKCIMKAAARQGPGMRQRILENCYALPPALACAAMSGHVSALKYLASLDIDVLRPYGFSSPGANALMQVCQVQPSCLTCMPYGC